MEIKKDYKKQLNNIIEKLNQPYYEERQFFSEVFFSVLIENLDFTTVRKNKWGKTYMKCTRDYNENILICLVIQKWIYNSIKKKDLSNRDLIIIRSLSLIYKFDDYEKIYNIYNKKYPNLKNPPRDFFEPYKIRSEYDKTYWAKLSKEHFMKLFLKYLEWNDFSTYIQPFTFDYYKRCIDFIMDQCDNKKYTKKTLLKIQLWIHAFLHDIKIDNSELTYLRTERSYRWDDSFDAVFHSEQIWESYVWTRNRFYEHYPKEIEEKFWNIIWRRNKK